MHRGKHGLFASNTFWLLAAPTTTKISQLPRQGGLSGFQMIFTRIMLVLSGVDFYAGGDAFSGKTVESHKGGIWRALVTLGGLRLPKSGFGPGTMLRCAGKSDSPPVSVVLICRPRRSQA